MVNLEALFTDVDDFCQLFEPEWRAHLLESKSRQRQRDCSMAMSEVMTLVILFHVTRYRDFKTFYTQHVRRFLTAEFPQLVSYTRMLSIKKECLIPLCAFLTSRKVKPTGIAFIDATKLAVCHNIRVPRNRVFDGLAERGKTSMGWFYGFKLHLIVNERGEIMEVKLTAGNVDDRAPVREMAKGLFGKLYGDKGYLSKALSDDLAEQDFTLITTISINMKPQVMALWDRIMLRKRYIIETIFDQLKNISQIEHSRHRSPIGFMLEVTAGLIAYTFQPQKPCLDLNYNEVGALMQI
jgi:hypothetical protein